MTRVAPLRILIADDHEIVRRGLRALLESHPALEIVGEADNGSTAVAEAIRLQPDIVVLDITMPGQNGLEAARQILADAPQVQILILTLHESEELVRQVLAVGARGLVLKGDSSRDLVAAIEALAQGRTFFTQKVSELVLSSFLTHGSVPMPEDVPATRLSPREREVVQLLAGGKSNKEIAWILKISVKTVETHRSNLMAKLNVHSMPELVRYAIRHKLIGC